MGLQVGVVSKPCRELEEIYLQLSLEPTLLVRSFLSPADAAIGLRSVGSFDILLLRMDSFEDRNLAMLTEIRSRFDRPILVVLAEHVNPSARFLLKSLNLRAALLSGSDIRDLARVLIKLSASRDFRTRQHPRTDRQEEASVLCAGGETLPARFLDFGRLGARLSLSSSLRPGERVLLSYESGSQGGPLRVESRVVWSTSHSVGLQFLAVVT